MPDEEKKKLLTADQIADLILVRDTIAAQVKVIDETIGLTVDQCPPGMTAATVTQASLLMAIGGIDLMEDVYEPPDTTSTAHLPVLQFLIGRPWDDDALNVVHSLRPSRIRVVVGGEEKTDSYPWRVHVYLDDQHRIVDVVQQVEVGCVGRKNGNDVMYYVEDRCARCQRRRVDHGDGRDCGDFMPGGRAP